MVMYHLFCHVLATKMGGLVIEPSESWDGLLDFALEITGMLHANFAAHVEDQKRMFGWDVFFNSAHIQETSQQQNCVMLSVTEAELIAACECTQEMIEFKQIDIFGLECEDPYLVVCGQF